MDDTLRPPPLDWCEPYRNSTSARRHSQNFLWTSDKPLAVDFIRNELPQYHAAFELHNSQYDPVLRQFVAVDPLARLQSPSTFTVSKAPASEPRPTPGPVNDMGFWAEIFPRSMERLKKEPPPSGDEGSPWSIRRQSLWRGVQSRLDMARREYDHHHHDSRTVRKGRMKLRTGCDQTAGLVQKGLKAVPNSTVAQPIVGVLSMVLDAYEQAAKVREGVHTGFDDLPSSFVQMDFWSRSFPKDENIINASIDLVVAMFRAVEEAVGFYTSTQGKRAGQAIAQGSKYQQTLLQSLAKIKSCREELKVQAEMSSEHRSKHQHEAMANQLNYMGAQLNEAVKKNEAQLRTINTVLCLLAETPRNWPPQSSPLRATTPQPRPQHWTPRELWTRLCIPNFDEEDIYYLLENYQQVFPEDRGRAEQMISTAHFRDWITAPTSSKLLVHGDFDESNYLDMSPFATLCATVMEAFRMSPGLISLAFFCGRHRSWDEYQGGMAMIQTLLAQLLRQFPSFVVEAVPGISIEGLASWPLGHLCKLFEHLLVQLPPSRTVFCIIDGVDVYESEQYLEEMRQVVGSLIHLSDGLRRARGPRFKLLLTSPRPTVEVQKAFDNEPESLLHMAQLHIDESEMGVFRIQEQLDASLYGDLQ